MLPGKKWGVWWCWGEEKKRENGKKKIGCLVTGKVRILFRPATAGLHPWHDSNLISREVPSSRHMFPVPPRGLIADAPTCLGTRPPCQSRGRAGESPHVGASIGVVNSLHFTSIIMAPKELSNGLSLAQSHTQWVAAYSANLSLKCLAAQQKDFGWSRIWTTNPSVIGQPTRPPEKWKRQVKRNEAHADICFEFPHIAGSRRFN